MITERLDEVLQVRVTAEEADTVRKIAEASGESISAVGRSLLLRSIDDLANLADFILED